MIACGCGPSASKTGTDTAAVASGDAVATRPTVGRPGPAFRAKTLAGDSTVIGIAGQPTTLVNVWATWCTSCREEMADLEAISKDYGSRGLRVLAVSVDAGSETMVRRYVANEKLTFPVVHDREGRIQTAYSIIGVPATYLIASDGTLLWQRLGGIHGATAETRAEVDRALTPR